jgi:hypothetical protein
MFRNCNNSKMIAIAPIGDPMADDLFLLLNNSIPSTWPLHVKEYNSDEEIDTIVRSDGYS